MSPYLNNEQNKIVKSKEIELIEILDRKRVNVFITRKNILSRLLANKCYELSLIICRKMYESNKLINSMSEIAVLQASSGEKSDAIKKFKDIINELETNSNNYNSNIYFDVVKKLANLNMYDMAINAANKCSNMDIRFEALLFVAEKQESSENASNAKSIINMAFSVAKKINDIYKRSEALIIIAEKQAVKSSVKESLEACKKIYSAIECSNNLARIAEKQASTGYKLESISTFYAAVATAEKILHTNECFKTLVGIAEKQADSGDRDGAKLTLNVALDTVYKYHENKERFKALLIIAEKQANFGNKEGATATFNVAIQTAKQFNYREFEHWDAFRKIIEKQISLEMFNEARETAELFDDRSEFTVTILNIAKKQIELGMLKEATKTVSYADADIGTSNYFKDDLLIMISDKQAESGKINIAIKTAKLINESINRVTQIATIAEKQARAGDRSGSQETFNLAIASCEHDIYEANTLANIAKKQAISGDKYGSNATFEKASAAEKRSDTAYYRSKKLREVAVSQAESGDKIGAKNTFIAAITAANQQMLLRSKSLNEIEKCKCKFGIV